MFYQGMICTIFIALRELRYPPKMQKFRLEIPNRKRIFKMSVNHWKFRTAQIILAALALCAHSVVGAQTPAGSKPVSSVYENLKKLNIDLPTAAAPVAAYVMYAQTGKTVYLSGHIAKKTTGPGLGNSAKT